MKSLRRSAPESRAHLEGFFDGNRCDVAHGELAGERGLAQQTDHEARHVVERSRDDAAVGPARCAFECAAQNNGRDHLLAFEAHIYVDTRRICRSSHRTVREPRARGHLRERRGDSLGDGCTHERHSVTRRRVVELFGERRGGRRDLVELRVVGVVRRERVDEVAQRAGGVRSGFVGRHGSQRTQVTT